MTVGALNMTTENLTIPERVAALEEIVRHLATRDDIANVKIDIANVLVDIANVKVDIAELKVIIARGQVNSIRWTIGAMFAIATLAVAAVKLL